MSTSKPVCVSASVIQQLRAALRPASEHNTVSVTLEDVSRRTLQELWQALESSSLTKSGGQSAWRFVVQNNQTSNTNSENGTFGLDRLPQITVVERTTTNNGAATSPCESGASSTHFQTSVSVRSEIVHFPIRTRVGHITHNSTNDSTVNNISTNNNTVNNNSTDTNRDNSTDTNQDKNTVSDLDLAKVRVHLCFTTRNDKLRPPTFMYTTQADSNVKSQTDATTIQDTANQDAAIQSTAIHTPQLVVRRQFAHTYTYTNKRGYEYVISVATCSDLDLEQAEPHKTRHGRQSNTSNTSNTSVDGLESALHDTRQQTRQLSIRYRINTQEAQTRENDKNAPSTSKSTSKSKSLLYHSLHCMNLLVQCVRGDLNMTLDTWDTED